MSTREIQRGFTLMEVLIVMGLFTAIALVTIPSFLETVQNYRASTAASEIAIELRFARNAAIKRKEAYTVTINDETATIPNSYAVTNDPRTHKLTDGVKIKTGSTGSFTFQTNGGATTGTVTIKDPKGSDRFLITVLATGAVQVTTL